MIGVTYEKIINKIVKQSGLSRDEIERNIEAKRAKLSGLISKEGAAQIVAAELGISFDKQKVKIYELFDGMRRISVIAKVMKIYPIRVFVKNGRENKVASLMVADDTASIRVIVWDTNHIKLLDEGKIKEGCVVEIKDASVRAGELHLGSGSEIILSSEKIDNVKIKEILQEKTLVELKPNDRVIVRATLLQVFEPRFFAVCPECYLRVRQEENRFMCDKHGAVVPMDRAIMAAIIDDGTATLRVIFFSDTLTKLFDITGDEIEKLKDSDYFIEKKDKLLGNEFWFSGRVRQNKLFGNLEFVVSDIVEVNPEELIERFNTREC